MKIRTTLLVHGNGGEWAVDRNDAPYWTTSRTPAEVYELLHAFFAVVYR